MPQYQTFPDEPGDSLTLDKLKCLRFPDLRGKRFLDVGCNEGFFCGFAKFQGAERVVGIDHTSGFIERARSRFPGCEFNQQSWDTLPEGPYDVILLASALHYADDQPALIDRLVSQLSLDGVLVLELGIYSSKASEWVEVRRGIDDRYFPTMPKLREILAPYAWKWMGPSVQQAGDPVKRHVVHISPRKPVAYLLLQPPAYGKSSIASRLFPSAGVRVISGDYILGMIAQGKHDAPCELRALVDDKYSPFRLDELLQAIFDAGLGPELVRLWAAEAKKKDFALDAYVPTESRALVMEQLREENFLPVLLEWERPGLRLLPTAELERRAEEFYMSMVDPRAQAEPGEPITPEGHIDEISLERERLTVRGWAFDEAGRLPSQLAVHHGGSTYIIEEFSRQLRPDVQRHFGLRHALVGFRFTVDLVDDNAKSDLQFQGCRNGAPHGPVFGKP